MMNRKLSLLPALLALLSFPIAAFADPFSDKKPSGPKGPKLDKCTKETRLSEDAEILRTIDGDTVHIRTREGSYSVRMLGMDTPETHFQGQSQGEWAEKAALLLAQLLPNGSRVRLEFQGESCDSHGRVLAHVFKGSLHANAEMARRGLAVNYCVAPDFAYCEEFSRLTQNAIDQRLGMFSQKDVELPYDFRRRLQNAPQRSYVGDIVTKVVRLPGRQNDTPVANRVFFYFKETIQAPYHLEE